MTLGDRLEKYRVTLLALQECDADLNEKGFTRDKDSARLQRWVEEERTRVNRAMTNFPAPSLPAAVRRNGS